MFLSQDPQTSFPNDDDVAMMGTTNSETSVGTSELLPAFVKREPSLSPAPPDCDNDMSNIRRVALFCDRLGFKHPTYVLRPSTEFPGMWSGKAEFEDIRVPRDVGVAKHVYSKNFAKELIANGVIVWLLNVSLEREEEAARILRESRP